MHVPSDHQVHLVARDSYDLVSLENASWTVSDSWTGNVEPCSDNLDSPVTWTWEPSSQLKDSLSVDEQELRQVSLLVTDSWSCSRVILRKIDSFAMLLLVVLAVMIPADDVVEETPDEEKTHLLGHDVTLVAEIDPGDSLLAAVVNSCYVSVENCFSDRVSHSVDDAFLVGTHFYGQVMTRLDELQSHHDGHGVQKRNQSEDDAPAPVDFLWGCYYFLVVPCCQCFLRHSSLVLQSDYVCWKGIPFFGH